MNNLSISEIRFNISRSASGSNTEERKGFIKCPKDFERTKSYTDDYPMQDKLLTGFGQVACLYIEEIEKPSVIKEPLVGLPIIDFESSATDLTEEQIQAAKNYYTDFVEKTVATLISKGYKNPQNEEDLVALCKDILSILWDNFTFAESVLLVSGLAAERKYLDCDTSGYIVADILNQFGVKSKLAILPEHLILHCEIPGAAIYLETTLVSDSFKFYKSEKELIERYYIIYGEYDFQVPNPALCTARGTAKAELEDFKGAIADYDKTIEIDPKLALAYYNRGLAKYFLKDFKGAIADFDKAIEINSKDAGAYFNRGNAKYFLKDFKGAIADYDKAIELDPKDADVYYNRGDAKGKLKDYEGAIADYDKTIEIDPKLARAYYNRGLAKFMSGDYKSTITDCTEAIEIDPKHAKAYFIRGCAKYALEDYEGSIADYDKAIEIDPKNADAYYNRGNAYSMLGRTTEAEQDFATYSKLTGTQK
jgi:tetratricopeptide (TPR) repeat protein